MPRKSTQTTPPSNNSTANGNVVVALTKELWQAAVNLRGSVEPADYKRYVLPIIFLRFLSLRYEKRRAELERAVRDLVDDSVESEGVVDIFQSAGLERADISILDDQFLQTFKDRPQENLRLKLLQRLVEDEIQLRRRQNVTRARSFKELLEVTLQKYHNRLIDAAEVVRVMIQIRQDMAAEEQRARALDLDADELAFYDAVAVNFFGLR